MKAYIDGQKVNIYSEDSGLYTVIVFNDKVHMRLRKAEILFNGDSISITGFQKVEDRLHETVHFDVEIKPKRRRR